VLPTYRLVIIFGLTGGGKILYVLVVNATRHADSRRCNHTMVGSARRQYLSISVRLCDWRHMAGLAGMLIARQSGPTSAWVTILSSSL
jgi:hypothetical protein